VASRVARCKSSCAEELTGLSVENKKHNQGDRSGWWQVKGMKQSRRQEWLRAGEGNETIDETAVAEGRWREWNNQGDMSGWGQVKGMKQSRRQEWLRAGARNETIKVTQGLTLALLLIFESRFSMCTLTVTSCQRVSLYKPTSSTLSHPFIFTVCISCKLVWPSLTKINTAINALHSNGYPHKNIHKQ